jgi:branched-chain amino acid transport system substrate-binding protein
MIKRLASVFIALLASIGWVQAAEMPGVTKTEIRIGGIFPFSGPASAVSAVGKGILAYVQSINDRGGINGRKINYIALDDAYSPIKAVEHARRLVESDEIAFMYGQLGTPTDAATIKYLNSRRVPSIGVSSGSHKFADIKEYPLSTTALVSFDIEGRIYARYLAEVFPNSKIAILYQNDDLGKDYVIGFKAVFKNEYEARVIAVPFEVTVPTVESLR